MVQPEVPVRFWHCPACGTRDQTQQAQDHTQMHPCPATSGLNVPLVEVASHSEDGNARHVIVPGENDVRGSNVGPVLVVAAVRTEHASGRVDATVFPYTAHAQGVQ